MRPYQFTTSEYGRVVMLDLDHVRAVTADGSDAVAVRIITDFSEEYIVSLPYKETCRIVFGPMDFAEKHVVTKEE